MTPLTAHKAAPTTLKNKSPLSSLRPPRDGRASASQAELVCLPGAGQCPPSSDFNPWAFQVRGSHKATKKQLAEWSSAARLLPWVWEDCPAWTLAFLCENGGDWSPLEQWFSHRDLIPISGS